MSEQLRQHIISAINDMKSRIEPAVLMAFLAVESGGAGFDKKTGKIKIQFEPHVFSSETGILRSETNHYHWDENKISNQPEEWIAFNEAFKISPTDAMESTSIGLPQIMGFHWKRLGYESVDAMWDDFKKGELNQIKALIRFINTDKRLNKAILEKDWHNVAYFYNGSGYAKQASNLGITPYNIQMKNQYEMFAKRYPSIQ